MGDKVFTTNHFIWLELCAAFIAALTFVSLKFKFSFKTAAFTMAAITLVSEISKIISSMEYVNGVDVADGMVIDPGALPFHLCSLLIFVFVYLSFCKNDGAKRYFTSLIVPVGLIGALLAVIMATSGTDFTEPGPYQCFVYHAAMIWFAIYLVATKQADLGFRAWIKNLATLLCLSIIMIWVNGALRMYDTNFLFVVRPPVDGLPILTLDNGWLAYFVTVIVCGFIGVTAVHLPALINEIRKK